MKLYHFCRERDLQSIAETGLHPHVSGRDHDGLMSLGQEVVWLTTSETTAVEGKQAE